jgi:hypothetical protein
VHVVRDAAIATPTIRCMVLIFIIMVVACIALFLDSENRNR